MKPEKEKQKGNVKPDKLTKENLETKSKGQLISIIQLLKQQTVSQKTAILRRDGIIRNYQTHLKHIARKIDYLQEHPYATDRGFGRLKDKKAQVNATFWILFMMIILFVAFILAVPPYYRIWILGG